MIERICKILMNIIIIILVLVAGILFVPRLFGYENFAVISGSMEPNMPVGSIVYSHLEDFNNIKVDDVISFKVNSETMVTHRVVEINQDDQSFITKGDANDVNDAEPVNYSQVIGVVHFCIPILGYIAMYLRTPLGIAAIFGIVFIILLLNFLPDLLKKDDK